MKVFLSWSGEQSRLVATALREWLPQIINAVEPFISSDIDAGARWQSEIADQLENTDFGICCVTAENQHAPWLNFEAGALAKKVGAGRVVPLAIDLNPAEIERPLGQFHGQPLTQAGVDKIALTINSYLPTPLPKERVEKAVKMWWPELDSELQQIDHQLSLSVIDAPVRTDRELLEEVLDTVRSLARKPLRALAILPLPSDDALPKPLSSLVLPPRLTGDADRGIPWRDFVKLLKVTNVSSSSTIEDALVTLVLNGILSPDFMPPEHEKSSDD